MSDAGGDTRILTSIINATRNAVQQERLNMSGLINATRNQFRPSDRISNSSSRSSINNNRQGRGRRRSADLTKTMFLLRRANTDFYPSAKECSFLQQLGLGKATATIPRYWSINRLHSYICEIYDRIPLEDIGFRFGKCGRDKEIVKINSVHSIQDLERTLCRNILIIIPNRDVILSEIREVNQPSPIEQSQIQTNSDDYDSDFEYIPNNISRRNQNIISSGSMTMTVASTSLPVKCAKSFYLKLGDPEREIPKDVLLDDFLNFVTESERYLIKKSLSSFSSLSDVEKDTLLDLFHANGLLECVRTSSCAKILPTVA